MLFNLEKCSVMHMGKGNQLSYEMGGKVLKVSEEERDLGVIMYRSAKPSSMGVDRRVDRGTNPPYFLELGEQSILCPPYFLMRISVSFCGCVYCNFFMIVTWQ